MTLTLWWLQTRRTQAVAAAKIMSRRSVGVSSAKSLHNISISHVNNNSGESSQVTRLQHHILWLMISILWIAFICSIEIVTNQSVFYKLNPWSWWFQQMSLISWVTQTWFLRSTGHNHCTDLHEIISPVFSQIFFRSSVPGSDQRVSTLSTQLGTLC